jgi:hypothetical protein
MFKYITITDIINYDKIIKDDLRNAGYNIGDLLNMPHLNNTWESFPHANIDILERMYLLSKNYENSILNYYCSGREEEENIPNINRIIKSVELFKNKNKNILIDILQIVKDPNCCCVHIRSGDLLVELEFIECILKLSDMFNKIILLSGVHLDELYRSEIDKKFIFVNTINHIMSQRDNIYVYLNNPDIHLSIMSEASNLLIHKGGFSCLGSIVCNGNLFITPYFTHAKESNWINKVNKKYILLNQ